MKLLKKKDKPVKEEEGWIEIKVPSHYSKHKKKEEEEDKEEKEDEESKEEEE